MSQESLQIGGRKEGLPADAKKEDSMKRAASLLAASRIIPGSPLAISRVKPSSSQKAVDISSQPTILSDDFHQVEKDRKRQEQELSRIKAFENMKVKHHAADALISPRNERQRSATNIERVRELKARKDASKASSASESLNKAVAILGQPTEDDRDDMIRSGGGPGGVRVTVEMEDELTNEDAARVIPIPTAEFMHYRTNAKPAFTAESGGYVESKITGQFFRVDDRTDLENATKVQGAWQEDDNSSKKILEAVNSMQLGLFLLYLLVTGCMTGAAFLQAFLMVGDPTASVFLSFYSAHVELLSRFFFMSTSFSAPYSVWYFMLEMKNCWRPNSTWAKIQSVGTVLGLAIAYICTLASSYTELQLLLRARNDPLWFDARTSGSETVLFESNLASWKVLCQTRFGALLVAWLLLSLNVYTLIFASKSFSKFEDCEISKD
jgi:hypothetical protein